MYERDKVSKKEHRIFEHSWNDRLQTSKWRTDKQNWPILNYLGSQAEEEMQMDF